jgi:hypothetical protein
LMLLIKNKLRNSMSVATLDAHMNVHSNGPSLKDREAILSVLVEAEQHWRTKITRYVQRSSNNKRPNRKKVLSLMLHANCTCTY